MLLRLVAAGIQETIMSSIYGSTASNNQISLYSELGLRPIRAHRVALIVCKLKIRHFSDEQITTVLTALYDQKEVHMKRAFRLFQGAGGPFLNTNEFKVLIRVLSTNDNDADQHDAHMESLFRSLDANKNGKMDFMEFCSIFQIVSPKSQLEEENQAFETMLANIKAILHLNDGDPNKSFLLKNLSTVAGLEVFSKMPLQPKQLQQLSRCVKKMDGAGYSEKDIDVVSRSVFYNKPDDVKRCFETLNREKKGQAETSITKDKYISMMSMMGEDASDKHHLEQSFAELDPTGLGSISYQQFERAAAVVYDKSKPDATTAFFTAMNIEHPHGSNSRASTPSSTPRSTTSTSSKKGKASTAVMSAFPAEIQLQLNPLQMSKAATVVVNMQEAGYNMEEITCVIHAMFLERTDEDMQAAFDVFDRDLSGSIDATEFATIVRLLGEHISENELVALFREIDVDSSQKIELEEFTHMIKSLNPKSSMFQRMFSHSGISDAWTTMSVLNLSSQLKMTPKELERMGKIISAMQSLDLTEADTNTVCRTFFVSQAIENLDAVYTLLLHRFGLLDREVFGLVVPVIYGDSELTGKSELDKLFAEIDSNRSGEIDFDEFCLTVRRYHVIEPDAAREREATLKSELPQALQTHFNPLQLVKAVRSLRALQKAGISTRDANRVIERIFVNGPEARSSERDNAILQASFKWLSSLQPEGHFGGARGCETMLRMMGEDIQGPLSAQFFATVHTSKRPTIEYDEFKQIVIALNPRTFDLGHRLAAVASSATFAESSTTAWNFLSLLDPTLRLQLSTLQLSRVGEIVGFLQNSGFSTSQINVVVSALFIECTTEALEAAFGVIDQQSRGFIPEGDIRLLLPLLSQQQISQRQIDEWMKKAQVRGHVVTLHQFETLLEEVRAVDSATGGETNRKTAKPFARRSSLQTGNQRFSNTKAKQFIEKQQAMLQHQSSMGPLDMRRSSIMVRTDEPNSVLDSQVKMKLTKSQLAKSNIVCSSLLSKGMDEDDINTIVRAMFMEQEKDDQMKLMFEILDVRGKGHMSMIEAHSAFTMLGERLSQDDFVIIVRELAEVPTSPVVDFNTFRSLVEFFNQTDDEGRLQSRFSIVAAITEPLEAAVGYVPGVSHAVLYNTSLDAKTRLFVPISKIPHACRIIKGLQKSYFSRADINAIICAVFGKAEAQLRQAFAIFDPEHRGHIRARNFRRLLRMLGDHEFSDEFVQDMFDKIDTDGSMKIEFNEFVAFVNQVNPDEAETGQNTVTSRLKGIAHSVTNTTNTLLALDADLQASFGISERIKAGEVAHRLEKKFGIQEVGVNAAIRVVYVGDIAFEDLEHFFDGLFPNRHNVVSPTHVHNILDVFFSTGLVQSYQTPELREAVFKRVEQTHVFGFDDLKAIALMLHPSESSFTETGQVVSKGSSEHLDENRVRSLLRRVSSMQIVDGERILAATRMLIRRKDRNRVSQLIAAMKAASYTDIQINCTVRALFIGHYSDVKQLFDMFDVTRDGTIDRTEFIKGLKIFGLESSSAVVEQLIAAVDEDQSGELEFDEYCTVIQALQSEYAAATFKIEMMQQTNWEATRDERSKVYKDTDDDDDDANDD